MFLVLKAVPYTIVLTNVTKKFDIDTGQCTVQLALSFLLGCFSSGWDLVWYHTAFHVVIISL